MTTVYVATMLTNNPLGMNRTLMVARIMPMIEAILLFAPSREPSSAAIRAMITMMPMRTNETNGGSTMPTELKSVWIMPNTSATSFPPVLAQEVASTAIAAAIHHALLLMLTE